MPNKPNSRNRGGALLDEIRGSRSWVEFARDPRLGGRYAASSLWEWAHGVFRPSFRNRRSLRDDLGIRLEAWDEPL